MSIKSWGSRRGQGWKWGWKTPGKLKLWVWLRQPWKELKSYRAECPLLEVTQPLGLLGRWPPTHSHPPQIFSCTVSYVY